jgi:rhodanese-related sulfurtransferase
MPEDIVREVDPLEAKKQIDAGAAVLIDVREAEEYAAARIDGSTLFPLSAFDPNAHAALKGKQVIVHCLMGGRSMRAAQALAPVLGAANVRSMAGGLNAWQALGLPVKNG